MKALIRSVAVLAVLGAPGVASAGHAVIFVHGTSDWNPSSQNPKVHSNALSGYWGGTSKVEAMKGNWPNYLVVGYPGSANAAESSASWGAVVDQVYDYMVTYGKTDFVFVCHSNGANVCRYIASHPTATTPQGRSVSSVSNKIRKIIVAGASSEGTPLANKVTDSGTFANIADAVIDFFGGGSWNTAAVWQQRTEVMSAANNNNVYGGYYGSTSIGNIPFAKVVGTAVYANIFSGKAWCGGYHLTAGLLATRCYAFGCSACSDGFIGCHSQRRVGSSIYEYSKLNHNQSRRACNGSGGAIAGAVNNTSYALDPDDTPVLPSAQACEGTYQGWDAQGAVWYPGCPSSWLNDGYLDSTCLGAYGEDDGYSAVDDYSATDYASFSCPDSWLGDGWCDACLIAKYGYDVAPGSSDGADDCVHAGTGGTNYCTDLGYEDGQTLILAAYSQTH